MYILSNRARDADINGKGSLNGGFLVKTLERTKEGMMFLCPFFVKLFTCFNRKKSDHDSS